MLKNLRAKANSKKPNTTLTLLSQPPDLGKLFNQPGKMANKVNGKAKASEKPVIPMAGPSKAPRVAASTSKVPMIGPVQLNDTNARVKAMKKMPNTPPRSVLASILFTQLEGKVISKAPRKEAPKTTSKTKKARLNQMSDARALSASEPKNTVTVSPRVT